MTKDNFVITEVTDDQMHMLRIVKVLPNNAGTYQVTATNPYGSVTCSATLNVEGIVTLDILTNLSGKQGYAGPIWCHGDSPGCLEGK